MTESYSTPSEVKHQEYLLEKSLQELKLYCNEIEVPETLSLLTNLKILALTFGFTYPTIVIVCTYALRIVNTSRLVRICS